MTVIGFIGSGKMGARVARLAVTAGYDVVLSNSRGPETLKDLVEILGPRAKAATPVEAAEASELAVISVPFKAYRQVPVEPLAGKTVIETNNYFPQRDGNFPELDSESTSVIGLFQDHLPTSRLVKAFSNISFRHVESLARLSGAADRSALAIAGDDTDAKAEVTRFLDRIGYDTVDAGGLVEERRFRWNTPAHVAPYGDSSGRPCGTEQLKALLAAADTQPGTIGGWVDPALFEQLSKAAEGMRDTPLGGV